MHLSIHVYLPIRRRNEISKCTLHVHHVFLQSLRSRLKFGDRVSLRWRSCPNFRETAKSFPQVFGWRELRRDRESIFYIEKQNIRFNFLFACSLLPQHLRCFSRLNMFVPSVFGALRNVSWRCCCWTRSGCNYVTVLLSLTIRHSRRKRNVFSSKCQGGR